jgi:hypothetical protein
MKTPNSEVLLSVSSRSDEGERFFDGRTALARRTSELTATFADRKEY